MRLAPRFLVGVVLLGGTCFAQELPRTEIFGGYSFEHISACGPSGSSDFFLCSVEEGINQPNNYHGWNLAGTFFLHKFLGFTADFAGHYGTTTVSGRGASGSFSTSRYSYMFGPVAALRSRRIGPFAHALFGRISNNFGQNAVVEAQNYGNFVWSLGGGIDLKATHHWSVRLGQFDYERTNEPSPGSSSGPSSAPVNGFRFATGIVFRP